MSRPRSRDGAPLTMPSARTYWHTVRHLRPVQVYGRLLFRAARPRPDLRPAPPCRAAADGWVAPARRRASLAGPTTFIFLNARGDLNAHGWDDPALEKLWRYNQHYFDDLNAEGAAARAAWHTPLIARWVRENPPGRGTGWDPYPTSLRIVNWVKWALGGGALPAEAVESLAVQARWLAHRLEVHLLGNHLFANAKALLFAGLFFEGAEATGWLRTGLAVLAREVPEQILADGGHFERSPMYHALAVEDVLDLVNVAAVYAGALPSPGHDAPAAWRARAAPMLDWLAAMCHPDGEIGLFNDAAVGVAPPPAELAAYAARLGVVASGAPDDGLTRLAASGYLRLARGPAVALVDVAPVGPDYLPAHAHADTLSFELSLGVSRVLVNGGTSRYGVGPARARERGTAAHNTVVVDGHDSSEVWGGFRVGRRARPFGVAAACDPVPGGACEARGAHDGYHHLPGRVTHARRWSLDAHGLVVDDALDGRFGRADARFHLHPAVAADVGADGAELRVAGGARVCVTCEGGVLRADPATWHPEFGRSEPTVCLTVRFEGAALRTTFVWEDA